MRSRTFGSAASAAIARPTNSGDSDSQEVRILLARLAPVVFGHAEVLQHGFRAQEAGRDGEDGDAMRREFGGPLEREHLLRHLDGMRHRIRAAADDVVLRDFHDQAALRGHHRERGMLRRDDARGEPLPEHRVGVPRDPPARGSRTRFSSGSSPATLSTTTSRRWWARRMRRNSAVDLALVRVIDAKRDGRAAGGLDHRRGLVDRLGPPVRRRLAFDASTGAVDRRAGFPERPCDAAAGAARRSRHEGHASSQRLAGGFSSWSPLLIN